MNSLSTLTPLRPGGPESIRTAPHNTEAEQALLGAIFRNNLAYGRVSDFLQPEHFSYAVHQRIYAAIAKLIERGQPANPVTLKNAFDQDSALVELGGSQYLTQLADSAITIINAEDYGRRIVDLHLRRQLIVVGEDVVNDAFRHDLDDDAASQIERAETRLFALSDTGQSGGGPQPASALGRLALDRIQAAHKRDRNVVGVATGLADLDRRIGGLRPGNLDILAGRPSMGKTSLAGTVALSAAKAGIPTAFFSLEMPGADLMTRLIAQEARVSAEDLFWGKLRPDDFDDVVRAEADLAKLPLVIDDTSTLTIGALRSRARRLKRRGGLGLIIVDYLQLMVPQDRRSNGNRVEEVAEISRGLKSIAKELDVPVVALSQLSRNVEQREDKRPQLSDLRESGSIEQDADVVMFIFREEYYLATRDDLKPREQELFERSRGIAEVIIAKNRNGAIGIAKLAFDAERISFGNLTRTEVR